MWSTRPRFTDLLGRSIRAFQAKNHPLYAPKQPVQPHRKQDSDISSSCESYYTHTLLGCRRWTHELARGITMGPFQVSREALFPLMDSQCNSALKPGAGVIMAMENECCAKFWLFVWAIIAEYRGQFSRPAGPHCRDFNNVGGNAEIRNIERG